MKSRIVQVILTTDGDKQTYHTLQGVLIGEFVGAHRLREGEQTSSSQKSAKNKGTVVTPLTPKQVKHRKDKEAEQELSLENRLQYEKDNNT